MDRMGNQGVLGKMVKQDQEGRQEKRDLLVHLDSLALLESQLLLAQLVSLEILVSETRKVVREALGFQAALVKTVLLVTRVKLAAKDFLVHRVHRVHVEFEV